MTHRRLWILAAVVAVAGALPALASGFSIYEQSAKASGQAGAWVARADDVAANWYNPAALTRLDGVHVQFGINLITIGSDTAFKVADEAWLALEDLDPPQEFETEQGLGTPIHLYVASKINDRLTFGFGLNAPFGLATEWKDRPVTYSSMKAELATLVANPNLAIKLNDKWSLAVGVDYLWADVSEFSREVDQSRLLGQAPGTVVGTSNLTGDGTAWGFNIAAQFVSDPWSFGLTYRSSLSPEIKGNVEFTGIHPALADAALFPNGPGATTLDLPAQAAVGVAYKLNDKWELEGDVSYAQWSSFEELAIDFENNTSVPGPLGPIPVVGDVVQVEDWENTFAVRFGAAWTLSAKQQWRFGAMWDKNPIPDHTLRPSIPDADRWSVTAGWGYTAKAWNLDAYYMPLFFQTRSAVGAPEGKPSANPYQVVDGVIDGEYSSFVHLFGATFTYRF